MIISNKEFNVLTQLKIFWKGVIEDNNDPIGIGRVRVRVLGVHDSSTSLVPTDTLPWSTCVKSLDFGGFQSGIGISSVPTKGTWVWCFPENFDTNSFVVIGAIPGISKTKQSGVGFTDPDGVYPKDEYLGKSDYNELQGADYLNNHAIQTPGGQLIELNDGGHIKITHKNGSFIQLTQSGDLNINVTSTTNIVSSGPINLTAPTTVMNTNVTVNGTVDTTGDISSSSNISASGSIMDGSGNSNHHSH